MKAKTLRGVIAIASATVSISAFANTTHDWFSANASANPVLVNVTTNGPVSVEDSKFVIDNDDDSPLVFTPDVVLTATNSTNISRIDVSAVMTPSRTNDFKTVNTAHVGFAVGIDGSNNTNYYGYVGNSWTNLGISAEAGTTAFSIILNYRDQDVTFIVGGNEIYGGSLAGTSVTTLSGLAAFGTGSISSVDAEYEVAVAAIVTDGGAKTNCYGSVSEAYAAKGNDESVQGISPTGETMPANATAANGLDYVVCEAMGLPVDSTTAEATIKLESATKSHANKITLAWKKPETAEGGVNILFQVKKDGINQGEACSWDDIQIPMESGTYTIEPSIQ